MPPAMSAARDRRPLFGASAAQSTTETDPESLEKENDKGIDALGERVSMLRNITSNIHGEVDSQHQILDRMAQSMGGIQLGLGASVDKFKKVMNEPQGRKMVYMAGGAALLLFILYLWLWR